MKMTRTQWKEILNELKTIRSTNKFGTGKVFYCEGYNEPVQEIRKINSDEMYIRFKEREYITHNDVLWTTPLDMRARFSITINPLYVETINYK